MSGESKLKLVLILLSRVQPTFNAVKVCKPKTIQNKNAFLFLLHHVNFILTSIYLK